MHQDHVHQHKTSGAGVNNIWVNQSVFLCIDWFIVFIDDERLIDHINNHHQSNSVPGHDKWTSESLVAVYIRLYMVNIKEDRDYRTIFVVYSPTSQLIFFKYFF